MIRYPNQSPFQQVIMAPLQALINTVPACELWIAFSNTIVLNMPDLSTGTLKNIYTIGHNMRKVFDYLHDNQTQSIPSSQYLLELSRSAEDIANNANLYALVATGTTGITITQQAQQALSTLGAWDASQGYNAPSNPGQLATQVMNGVSIP